jgi:hypothetical protein
MLFTQDLGTKRSTFGRSSMSTLWKDHEAWHKSTHMMNMTPNDPRTEASTCKSSGTQPENSEAWIARIQALTMKETTSKAQMQVHTNKESREKQPGRNRGQTGLEQAWADRPSPLWARFDAPFALGVHLFIASTTVGRHIDPTILPLRITRKPLPQDEGDVANMASYAISSSLILVIHDNMIIGTNHIVLACLCRHF